MSPNIPAIAAPADEVLATVFSDRRMIEAPPVDLPTSHRLDERLTMTAGELLGGIGDDTIPAAFFDPQYRGVLDKLAFGNEGEQRGQRRAGLPQMTEADIAAIIRDLNRVLIPSGHLFLWLDKFHLCTGFSPWLDNTTFETVDLLTWHKQRIGMGYRTRRTAEYLVVLQKAPKRAKGVWSIHTIPDVWTEKVNRNGHTHRKPTDLQGELIAAVTNAGDIIVDPAAGSFSVMDAAHTRGRHFLGCDILG